MQRSMVNKVTLRKAYLEQRKKIQNKKQKNKDIASHAISLLYNAKYVGIYSSLPNEIDTLEIFNALKQKCCYPKVIGNDMVFYKVNEQDQLEKGTYGILEPNCECSIIAKDQLDAIIIPCVCINKNGYRIGYGKGYYDRYLENYKGLKIVLVYHQLICEANFQEKHDIPADIYIDETGISKIKK